MEPYGSEEVQEELFGRKLNAFVQRTTPKDLYDTFKLLESGLSIDRKIVDYPFF